MAERLIYLVRHGVAEDISPTGHDADRELTDEGRSKTRLAARGLALLGVEVELIATSPLKRAEQTADLIGATLASARRETWLELAPGVDERALSDRIDQDATQRVMLVGHEPDFGELLAFWLSGRRGGFRTHFRKAAVACISAGGFTPQGRGTLEWFATARQLGRIAQGRD